MSEVINKTKIDIDEIIENVERQLNVSFNPKPKVDLANYPSSFFAGTSLDTIYLNSVYVSFENGNYYVLSKNVDLLKMRITHELIHFLSYNGICDKKYYDYNNRIGENYRINYNNDLNEGITQMITDNCLEKETNSFCDGYYDVKKVAQLLSFLFSTDIVYKAYFDSNEILRKGVNQYSNGLYELLNEKLTKSMYINSMMKHMNFDEEHNANFSIEKDICKSLRSKSIDECYELIINNLIYPWFIDLPNEQKEKEANKLLELFDDNVTLKNKIVNYLINAHENNKTIDNIHSETDYIISNIISSNNGVSYEILDNGCIVNKSTNEILPYYEELYEYIYSKNINKYFWNIMESSFSNIDLSSNSFKVSISDKTIKERRMIMTVLKQYMKKNKIDVLNDLNSLDNGDSFEINFVNEKVRMNDIIYLNNNYECITSPEDKSNILQVINKKTGSKVKSNSLIRKCRLAYKLSTLGLDSMNYKNSWESFFNTAEKQISETGIIKKSIDCNNNPFTMLFKDGFGCEWFYDYMSKIPIKFDRINQELYITENELNNSRNNSKQDNLRLSQMISSYIQNDNNSKIR